ncbi:MAG: pyridoxal phosphate-dependent decarboxylase family protein [Phenylobacterium sp.]
MKTASRLEQGAGASSSAQAGSAHHAHFARALHHAIGFRNALTDGPPRPTCPAAELHRRFDGPTPEAGEDGVSVIDSLAWAAEPGLSGVGGTRFFGWVVGASHPVGVAADMMTSAWGQNAGNYALAPSAAMAEKVSSRWLLNILRLPPECSVGFVTGATMASFVCLAAARNAVLARVGWDVEEAGLTGAPAVRLFLGAEAHSTITSALRYLGFGARTAVIPCDAEGRMDADALSAALAVGNGPAIVMAQAGQINTGAFDPMPAIAEACRAHGAWLHVDGAFGLWARAVPEMEPLTAGLDQADSWSTDGHKWLQLPYDCGFAIVRDRGVHRAAMSIVASYLPPAADDEYDPAQFAPELSRRARGFAVWAMLRTLGRQGVIEMVRRHCALARRLAERLAGEAGVRVINSVVLNQVIVGFGEGPADERDAATRAVIAQLQEENVCFAAGASWRDRWVLRFSIISGPLTPADIDRLAGAVLHAWRLVRNRKHANTDVLVMQDQEEAR